MACQNPGCMKKYDYDSIAYYARKRYVEGVATIVLLCEAKNEDEKTLIVLASLLDVEDQRVRELMPHCSRQCQCLMLQLRNRLRIMIEHERCRRWAAENGHRVTDLAGRTGHTGHAGRTGREDRAGPPPGVALRSGRILPGQAAVVALR